MIRPAPMRLISIRPAGIRAGGKLVLATLLAIGLSGCISVLPKTKPAKLYRFGVPAAEAPAPRQEAIGVLRTNGLFPREAAGDRILTMTGEQASYIADTRWVAPAEVLFDAAVANAFEAAPGRVRLIARGEPVRADLALRLDVRNFETRYGEGPNPVVVIRVRALLIRNAARDQPLEQVFEARAPAGRNRVGAIVEAYNAALAKVLADVVAWTEASAA